MLDRQRINQSLHGTKVIGQTSRLCPFHEKGGVGMTVRVQSPLGYLQLLESRELTLGFEPFRLLAKHVAGSRLRNTATQKLAEDGMAEGDL
jgi:hypothetical protein